MKKLIILLVALALLPFMKLSGQIENPRDVEQEWTTDTIQRDIPLSDLKALLKRNQIKPVENPDYNSTDEVGDQYLEKEPVVAVEINGEARAFPVNMLSYHEIVNDKIKGVPFAVTYCPLCNSALVFNRRLEYEGKEYTLTFGTSGMLRKSNLVMWDEETETWWQQFTGEAIVGKLTGAQLKIMPSQMIALNDFIENYPNGKVLSMDTGGDVPKEKYHMNPYAQYDALSNTRPRLFDGEVDDRLPAMTRIINLSNGEKQKAYPLETIRKEKVINDQIGDKQVVLLYDEGMLSNLDAVKLESSKDIGAAVAYNAKLNGQVYTFKKTEEGFIDKQTGSKWNLAGKCIKGKLKGKHLKPEEGGHHFAFAYFAFYPEAEVYGKE